MLRGGPQVSAQDDDNSKQQQKQKKKLSFRDPEVEGPLRNNYHYTGCRSKTLIKPTKATNSKKTSASVEDLTLEDHALQIAQNVGNAFSDITVTDKNQNNYSGFKSITTDFEAQKETEIIDSSPSNFALYQRTCQLRSFKISAEDQEFLNDLAPPLLDMRGPSAESSDPNPPKNCIPDEPPQYEERPSTSSNSNNQHQIQLLRYQLEQQNQQTQMALYQVQLLQDQVDAESTARRKAQEQNNQLMQQNKELLSHMERLFQQIEDLERQVQALEQEKRGKRVLASPESQVTSLRKPTTWAASRRSSTEQEIEKPSTWAARRRSSIEQANEKSSAWAAIRRSSIEQLKDKPISWAGSRRPSTEQVNEKPNAWTASNESMSEKPSFRNRSQYTTPKKNPVTSTKPQGATPKTSVTQNSTPVSTTKKAPSFSSKPFIFQTQGKDSGTKEKETLRIGDASPPVQSGIANPFSSPWKLKAADSSNTQSNADKSLGSTSRSRTSSFSSYVKREQEENTPRSTLFNNSNTNTSITGKKYSSSTSDLYSNSMQGKSPLMLEDPGVKTAISNLNISTSKLPRYQPYTGWQRKSSFTSDSEQVSAISKDSYKNAPKISLFNR